MAASQPHRQFMGVVVSAGKMMKTVKVRMANQKWNKRIGKYFSSHHSVLVSDPSESVREGDIVTLRSGWRASRNVHHVITSIVAPFGSPLSQRPPLPTEAERLAGREEKRAAKDIKRLASGNERARESARERIREREERQTQKSEGLEVGSITSQIKSINLASRTSQSTRAKGQDDKTLQ